MFVIGIDPGASGAVAILEEGGKFVMVFDMPSMVIKVGSAMKNRVSPEMLADELRGYAGPGARAVIEKVSAMPGQGVSSMFAFGESYGLARGVLAGLGIPCSTVTPQQWKKWHNVNASKDGSRAKAAQLWPLNAGDFKRVKDDGRAEACLIAEWGRVVS